MAYLDIENFNKTFSDGFQVLKDINFSIEKGQALSIIGSSGSGKTTFVQHLNGLIKLGVDKGFVKIGEFDLTDKKCDYMRLRSKVGMVFQYPEHQLFAETVFDDVAFALKNFEPSLSKEQVEDRVRSAIEMVGLDYQSVKEKSPFELSGGQKRRVAIAGVIVAKPEVLVLDEPAAGLDPQGKKYFLQLLHTLHKEFVKTIIIVSHYMNVISEHCTKTAVFSGGKLCAVGTPKEVFGDYELIERLNLDLPTTAKIIKQLNAKGIQIDCDLTVKDFVRAIRQKGDR